MIARSCVTPRLVCSRLRCVGMRPSIGRGLGWPASETTLRRASDDPASACDTMHGARTQLIVCLRNHAYAGTLATRLRGCRWPRNCSVAARQVNSPARATASSRSSLSALEAGGAQILVQHARLRIADHIARTGDRIRRHRQAAGHGLQQHQAEGVGLARKHEHIGRGVHLRELFAVEQARDSSPCG